MPSCGVTRGMIFWHLPIHNIHVCSTEISNIDLINIDVCLIHEALRLTFRLPLQKVVAIMCQIIQSCQNSGSVKTCEVGYI